MGEGSPSRARALQTISLVFFSHCPKEANLIPNQGFSAMVSPESFSLFLDEQEGPVLSIPKHSDDSLEGIEGLNMFSGYTTSS